MSFDITTIIIAASLGLASFAITVTLLSLKWFAHRRNIDSSLTFDEIELGLLSRLKKIEEDIVDIRVQLQIAEMRKSGGRVPGTLVAASNEETTTPENPISEHEFVPVVHPEFPGERPIELSETDLLTLKALRDGPKSSRELERFLHRSREHTARLLKRLFDNGYVYRDETSKPFVYKLTGKGSQVLTPTLKSGS
jgi:hypothetical protein